MTGCRRARFCSGPEFKIEKKRLRMNSAWKLRSTRLLLCGWIILMVLAVLTAAASAEPIQMGEPFPAVPLPAPADAGQRDYLGLEAAEPFTLDDVDGGVVLVEMLNVLCPHCVKQTVPYNRLYDMLAADPVTRGKIKMLGVAVANSDAQIDDFVVIYDVRYPVVPDRKFALHRAVRGGPTPFSIYVLRDEPDQVGVVAGTHLGEDHDMESLFNYLKYLLLEADAGEFASLYDGQATATRTVPEPPMPAEAIAEQVREAFAAQGDALEDFRRLDLPSGLWVYTASVRKDGRRQPLFAEVASRSAICDICHNVHFFYLFDPQGTVLAFEALHLTKYGNEEWDQAELAGFKQRVLGKRLAGAWDFDPQADAVTSATMTSAIIFDSLEQGQQLLEELREQGLL